MIVDEVNQDNYNDVKMVEFFLNTGYLKLALNSFASWLSV